MLSKLKDKGIKSFACVHVLQGRNHWNIPNPKTGGAAQRSFHGFIPHKHDADSV